MARQIEAPSRISASDVDLSKVDYDTDILVIGCGGAGLSAALTAHAAGARVMLTTKLRMGDSNTIMAEGGIAAATNPEDSPAIHYVDTIIGGRGTNVKELVEVLVTEAPSSWTGCHSLGVNFDRKADGSLFNHRPGGHSRRRSHSIKDLTGLEIMRVMADEVRNRDIPSWNSARPWSSSRTRRASAPVPSCRTLIPDACWSCVPNRSSWPQAAWGACTRWASPPPTTTGPRPTVSSWATVPAPS